MYSVGNVVRGGRFKGLTNMYFSGRSGPREPPKSAGNGGPGPPDILGLSSEILVFEIGMGGSVGHPQGVQVKTLTLNIKCLPKGHHGFLRDGAARKGRAICMCKARRLRTLRACYDFGARGSTC